MAVGDTTWTEAQDALLLDCVNKGMSASQAAMLLGKTRNAAIGRAQRTRLRFHSGENDAILRAAINKPRPPKPVRTYPKPIFEPSPESSVPIWDLNQFHCRWIFGDPKDTENHRYCGSAKPLDVSYCAFHAKLMYEPRPQKKVAQEEKRL